MTIGLELKKEKIWREKFGGACGTSQNDAFMHDARVVVHYVIHVNDAGRLMLRGRTNPNQNSISM